MAEVGNWKINVSTSGMPEKVATAFTDFATSILGAEYTPIAYLGSQVVNGTNHAVLAEQLLTTGKDTKNVVVVIFNEKNDKVTLVNIERVVESGEAMGGIKVEPTVKIPEEAVKAFDTALGGFVGAVVKPFALLATQVTKGINYVFATTVTPITEEPATKVAIVTVNALTKKVSFADVLRSDLEISLGKPLGEWP